MKPRNIFILEDNYKRIEWFEKNFGEQTDSFYIATTSQNALHILSTHHSKWDEALTQIEWDIVFLDHDLGYDEDRRSFDEGTGMEVAKYFVQTRPGAKKIVIHSWNPEGSKNMLRGLISCGYDTKWFPFDPTETYLATVLNFANE